MYVNRIIISGRLVANPDFGKHESDSDKDRVWGRIACNSPSKKDPDYVCFVAWGKTARAAAEHCKKGKEILLDGRLSTRQEQRADGSWNHYSEVNCTSISYGADAKNTAPAEASAPAPALPPGLTPALVMQMLQQLAASQSMPAPTPAMEDVNDSEAPFLL